MFFGKDIERYIGYIAWGIQITSEFEYKLAQCMPILKKKLKQL